MEDFGSDKAFYVKWFIEAKSCMRIGVRVFFDEVVRLAAFNSKQNTWTSSAWCAKEGEDRLPTSGRRDGSE